ncbi:hypothetical protein T492DRAFT_889530 [Pavlovales sp. CCMP2436]|nr:hypothetical protein T492DRAFT_889530 [Pavlovales sp. CCMP2436]
MEVDDVTKPAAALFVDDPIGVRPVKKYIRPGGTAAMTAPSPLLEVAEDEEAENKALESLRNAGPPDRRGPQREGAVERLAEEGAEGAETSSASEST